MDGVGGQLINLCHRIGKETKMNKKVSKIELHFTPREANDCILRAARLIREEGYSIEHFQITETELYYHTGELASPNLHLILEKPKYD